jgi:hypothetical protein
MVTSPRRVSGSAAAGKHRVVASSATNTPVANMVSSTSSPFTRCSTAEAAESTTAAVHAPRLRRRSPRARPISTRPTASVPAAAMVGTNRGNSSTTTSRRLRRAGNSALTTPTAPSSVTRRDSQRGAQACRPAHQRTTLIITRGRYRVAAPTAFWPVGVSVVVMPIAAPLDAVTARIATVPMMRPAAVITLCRSGATTPSSTELSRCVVDHHFSITTTCRCATR